MFKKILVANRGEIACRVIKTARKLGIKTVAVYSDADQNALHCHLADESIRIGPAPAVESYLVIENILAAIEETGSDAVHPGYGFLSENSVFEETLSRLNVTFIGPSSKSIKAMGDKIQSKIIANAANISTIPGSNVAVRESDEAEKIANEIGYPIMLKASAGGGGKGMRLAWNNQECRDGLTRAISEAKASFGDDRVFIEKFIEDPRHIEIQIVADKHENIVYLAERECSIQRRHQKVIEEAPSPFLDDTTRRAMGEQAVRLAKAVNYQSVGTVEFVVDKNKNFYFLEMNTRLQVEHPVTEAITGYDLVELMIKIAAGEEIPFKQADIKVTGWALESRIYAEDPSRNFLPSIGRLVNYISPKENRNIRVDSGVREGDEISIHYDPMIAKLISTGEERDEAIRLMISALDSYFIRGVRHNIEFLSALVAHPKFKSGDLTTNFIAEEFPDGFHPQGLPARDPVVPIVVAASVNYAFQQRAASQVDPVLVLNQSISNDWVVVTKDGNYNVTVRQTTDRYIVSLPECQFELKTEWQLGEPLLHGTLNDEGICVQVEPNEVSFRITHGGSQYNILVLRKRHAELNTLMPQKKSADTSKSLLSPMPGLLLSLDVEEGQEVKTGEVLAIIEAMKMENVLRAERDVVISKLNTKVGESLMVDQVIMEFV